MTNKYEGIIFDFDGTLVDSMGMWLQIDKEYLDRFNILLPDKLQSEIEGMSFSETATYFKERFEIPHSVEEIKDDWTKMAWDKYTNEVPLKEGVIEFLEFCKMNGFKMGIATSNSRILIDGLVAVHNLEKYFDCIITGCDVTKGKPSPDVYLMAASSMDVKPENCLVFEDIVPGIMAGLNAGMTVCAVEDCYSKDMKQEKMQLANYFINDFKEVFSLFD